MPYDAIPDSVPLLRGHGLTLRELAEEDLPAWLERRSDVEAAGLAGDPVVTSMDELVEGLRFQRRAFREKESVRWAIVPDELGVSVGSIGFSSFREADKSAEIGAVIGRAHWGRGIVTSAGRLVIEYGFGVLGLASVEAVALARNARVIRVLEKLGFERQAEPPVGRGVGEADGESVLFVLRRESGQRVGP
jgi:RimJ/RimL family protein N-acetyltransferase